MNARALGNVLFLMLARHRSKHLAVFVFSVLLVALVAAVLFLSGAIRRELNSTLEGQADAVVQRMHGGRMIDVPVEWIDGFAAIPGVSQAVPRVFGRYYHEPNGAYFTVVGLDFFAEPTTDRLADLVGKLDLRAFLAGDRMIVGNGVRRFLDQMHYTDSYVFYTPQAVPVEVVVHDVLPDETGLVAGDFVLMEIDLAREVLGVASDRATDIVLDVPNELEGDAVMGKIIQQHYDVRVIQKKELDEGYRNLFNTRSGIFLVLYLIVLAAFTLILYQRYSLITGSDRHEIGILRATGWSIGQVIVLKMLESFTVALAAYFLGVILAYGYVFGLGGPLLASIFVGFQNLPADFSAGRMVDPGVLGLLFLFFIAPFLAAVLVPVWRVAVVDPCEALK
jgi:putative ABC transport system permease protein